MMVISGHPMVPGHKPLDVNISAFQLSMTTWWELRAAAEEFTPP